jgi:hypothetical protein
MNHLHNEANHVDYYLTKYILDAFHPKLMADALGERARAIVYNHKMSDPDSSVDDYISYNDIIRARNPVELANITPAKTKVMFQHLRTGQIEYAVTRGRNPEKMMKLFDIYGVDYTAALNEPD